MKREIDITGKYIGNAIGFCHCSTHIGALNKKLAYEHKCLAKNCKYLEKYDEEQWKSKDKYYNSQKGVRRKWVK